jgi:hypothetical protein
VSARIARLALRLYPLAYRRRYGAEMEALLEDSGAGPGAALDLFRGAIAAHLRPEPGLAAEVGRDERLRRGLFAALACWFLFAIAGLAFYKTTEGKPFEGVGGTPSALGALHLAIQVLAVVGGVAALVGLTPFLLATLRGGGGARVSARRLRAGRMPRRALGLARICAAVLAGAMVEIAALTAAYLVAITTAAPHLAGEPNGPFGTPDVAISLAIQLVAMILVAALSMLVAARTWRAAAR